MEIYQTVLFLISLLFVLVILIIGWKKDIKQRKIEEKRLLEIEKIYDPDSGLSLTLEEIENQTFINHDNLDRIKSEKEIEKYYHGEEVEKEKIRNFLIKNSFKTSEVNDELFCELISFNFFKQYIHKSIRYKYEKNNLFITFPQIGKLLLLESGIDNYHYDDILMVTKKLDFDGGHQVLLPFSNIENRANKNQFHLILNNFGVYEIIKSKNDLKTIRILKIIDTLKGYYYAEIKNNLFIIICHDINIKDAKKFLSVVKTC